MDMVVNNKICKLVFLKEIQTLFHLNRKWYPKVFSDVHVKSISMAPASRNFCFCAWMWTTSNIVLQVPFHTGCEGYQSKKPGTGNQKPETRNQEPGTRNQEPETRNQKPGTRNQKPGTRDQESETKNWNLKTPMLLLLCLDVNNLEYCITSSITQWLWGVSKSKTRNREPETRNQKPGLSEQEPESRNQKPRTEN